MRQLKQPGPQRCFAARDDKEFVRIAVELTGDLVRLSSLRTTLREKLRQSRRCAMRPRFARDVEGGVPGRMWRRWCENANASSAACRSENRSVKCRYPRICFSRHFHPEVIADRRFTAVIFQIRSHAIKHIARFGASVIQGFIGK